MNSCRGICRLRDAALRRCIDGLSRPHLYARRRGPAHGRERRAHRGGHGELSQCGHGELVHIHDGSENGLTGLTERDVECVEDLLADIRTWPGGIHRCLIDQHCDEDIIRRILAK